ncbi:MAG: hypothetical protein ABWX96_09060 [Propionibacteriaceae bacterium]
MEERLRPVGTWSKTWRIVVVLLGIALLVNGSLRESDDVWPFGPLSQYAFSPKDGDSIVITRVEGQLTDGRRIDLPLSVESAGIGRAEVEARIPQIEADPTLLRSVAEGWSARHAGATLQQVWLVQDVTTLVDGRKGPTTLVELATWRVPR